MFDSWKIDSQGAPGFSRNRYLLAVCGTLALAALAAIAATLSVGVANAATPTSFDPDGTYSSIAGTNLNPAHVGANSDTFKTEEEACTDPIEGLPENESLDPGQVLWHFVLTSTEAENTGSLRAEFDSAGVTDPDVHRYKSSGGVLHWAVVTDTSDILLAASTDAVNNNLNLSHVCRGESQAASSEITTTVHLGADDTGGATVVDNDNPAALGSTVHDSAELTTDPVGTTLPANSSVTFYLYNDNGCDDSTESDTGASADSQSHDVSGQTSPVSIDPALVTDPLHAGEYSYRAYFTSGDTDVVTHSAGACEPFKVDMSDTNTTTQVHNAAHQDITGKGVAAGSLVHDNASVVGNPSTPFPVTGTVTYSLYKSSDCTGDKFQADETVDVGEESTAVPINTPGNYSYSVTYNGDADPDDYNPSTAECEPFSVFQPGKTMGFWGNNNGQAFIINHGGYGGNAVAIGRGSNIDTQPESLKVLPNTLNACGKGSVVIFSGQTNTLNCTLASGVNVNTLNTAAAQTLALGYNIKLVTTLNGFPANYDGQTISGMGCTAVGSLTGSSKVGAVFTYAVGLINNSASGGSTTQPQLGALNTLLGCLNREA
jgi:hypothetical protein